MKINKRYLLLRIITLPIKLTFHLLWSVLFSILITLKWLKNGGEEIFYGVNTETTLIKILKQLENENR